MSRMALRPEQQSAVERTGQDVCVVAGPGSGKTRVLIARFAWLVEERGVAPGRILAVTFTEKAATEIKQRLVLRFADRPDLLSDIERAYVSTVHGFCARLLREHAIAAGLDPEFVVMEEAQAISELRAAVEETLDQMLEEDVGTFRRFLQSMGVSNNPAAEDQDLTSALLEVYEAFRISGADWEALPAMPQSNALERITELARVVLDDRTPNLTYKQREGHLAARDWAVSWLELPPGPATVEHFRRLRQGCAISLATLKTGSPCRTAMTSIKQDLQDDALAQLAGDYYQDLRSVIPRALERLDQAYRARKQVRSLVDFSDLEELAIQLLSHDRVRAEVQASFDYILMDELQDTNPLQWRLLDAIRRPERFFGVGDINQSIYGFRHADPEVFRGYRDSLEQGGFAIDELRENHRSRAAILEAVNRFVATGEPGIEPHELIPRHEYPVKAEPSVEMRVAAAESVDAGVEVEATLIARRMRELEGTLLVGEPGEQHPARFADMAVLMRSLNGVSTLTRAFDEFQVPYLVVGGRTFFELPEIRDLVQLLRALDNPLDETALARVLRSPLVSVSDETLLRLKLNRGVLIEEMQRFDPSNTDVDEAARLSEFTSLFLKLRRIRDEVAPDRLLARVIDGSGYEEGLKPAEAANVKKFLAMLRDRYAAGARVTGNLSLELEILRQAESEAEAPPDNSSNAVRIMTVHKAKGLEFPIVFLPMLHRPPSGGTPNIGYSHSHGLGVRWRDPSCTENIGDLAHRRTAEEIVRREAAEENRLLYVALSRAREHLVLSWTEAPKGKSYWQKKLRSALGVEPGIARERAVNDLAPPLGDPEEQGEWVLAPPAAEHQEDITASVTSLSVFETCPRRYYLGRYIGWAVDRTDEPAPAVELVPIPKGQMTLRFDEPAATPLSAAELGTQVHAILAGQPGESPHPEAIALAEQFHSSPLGRRAARAQRKEHEFDFVFAWENLVLRGQIDLWFEEGGELVLVDYKTDRTEQHASSHALQLQVYARALERALGRMPDRAVLFYLRTGHEMTVPLDEQAYARVLGVMSRLREAQNTQQFPLHVADHCRSCDFYRGLCPAGSS